MMSFLEKRAHHLPLFALVLPAALSVAQAPRQSGSFKISGRPEKAPLVRVDGKSYVEIEALARLLDASLSFQGNQVTLTLSGSTASQAANAQDKQGFSTNFLKASIEELTVIREWRIAIAQAIQNNFPLLEDWVGPYRRAAESKHAQTAAVAVTNDDRSLIPLLTNHMGNMQKLSAHYLGLRQSQTYIPRDALANDSLDQEILSCGRGLAAVAASGKLQDVSSCQ